MLIITVGVLEFTISDDIGEGINNRINLFIKNDHIHYHCGPVTYADKDNRGFSYSNNNIDDIYLACFEKGMNGVWKKKFGMLLTFERLIILYYQ